MVNGGGRRVLVYSEGGTSSSGRSSLGFLVTTSSVRSCTTIWALREDKTGLGDSSSGADSGFGGFILSTRSSSGDRGSASIVIVSGVGGSGDVLRTGVIRINSRLIGSNSNGGGLGTSGITPIGVSGGSVGSGTSTSASSGVQVQTVSTATAPATCVQCTVYNA